MNISISNKAQNHLRSIAEFSAKISINYSNRVIQDIYSNIYSNIYKLKDYPYIGRYVPEIQSSHYRERIYKNYRIIYVVSEKYNTIFIRYIFSSRQDKVTFFEVHKKEIFDFLNFFI